MSKVKAAKGSKGSKSDEVLTKVKGASVTKSAKTDKSKDVAKELTKKDKKSKKVKEPTPEPESDSESDTSASETEDSDSEVDAKPVTNVKAAAKKPVAKDDSSSDESDSDSEPEVKAAPKTNGAAKAAPPADDDSDSSSESDSEEEATAKVTTAKVNGAAKKGAAKKEESDSDSDSESEDEKKPAQSKVMGAKVGVTADDDETSDDSSSDDSDAEEAKPAKGVKNEVKAEDSDSDSSESEKEEVKPKTNKRKAEEDAPQTAKKIKVDGEEKEASKNLFVGNLSWNVTEEWLKEEFEAYGEVEGVRIMTDRATQRSKGFGYVEFKNVDDAIKALQEKKGADLDGRALNVDFSNPRPDQGQRQENRRQQYSDQLSEPSDTLFVGNLSFDAGQDAVTQAFEPFGTPVGVRIPTDPDTGNYKGFGYVTFGSIDEAKQVLESMQGQYIEGRPIRLDFSQPRPQNSGRGGFGDRGRGRGGDRGGRGGRGRGGFGDRGGRGGGRGGFDRGRGRGASTNRGGFGDYSGKKTTF